MVDLRPYFRNPVAFLDDLVKRNELGRPWTLAPHQREVLTLAFKFDGRGRLPWDTIVYACPKKSGKTTINAALTAWWAFTQEPPNECPILANDLEQAQGRAFRSLVGLLQHNADLKPSAEIQAKVIRLSNGTIIPALANDYQGEAGGNHGWSSWEELWAFISEASRRLWEELTPVPTRRNSVRFISTYAGFEGESDLLWDLYKLGVGTEEHPEGQGERLHPTLPIFGNRAARLFVYWDHEPRMRWQTPHYYEAQRRVLRANTYLRFHENRWTTAVSAFVTPELWDPCVMPGLRPMLPSKACRLYVGVDAATKHDTAAVVAVSCDGPRVVAALHRIWKPSPEQPLDLEATIEQYLLELDARYTLVRVCCDPYQLHRSITTLKAAGLPIEEFPQTTVNTTRMGQTLFDLLIGRNLSLYPADDLRQQALNTVAVESPRGWRIAKERASKKIDAIAALSIACVAALEEGGTCEVRLLGDNHELSAEELEAEAAHEAEARRDASAQEIVETVSSAGVWFPGDGAPPSFFERLERGL